MKNFILYFIIIITCTFYSCGRKDATLNLKLNAETGSGLISIDSVSATIENINYASLRNRKEISGSIDGHSGETDLLFNGLTGNITIMEGSHTKVRTQIKINKANPITAFYISGTYQNTPVQIYLHENLSIPAAGPDFNIDEGQPKTAQINIDIQKLLEDITASDLDNAIRSSGVIIIAIDPNYNLYQKILGNINSCATMQFE